MRRLQVVDGETPVCDAAPTVPTRGYSHGRSSGGPLALRKLGAALTAMGLATVTVVTLALVLPSIDGGGPPEPGQPPPALSGVIGPTTVRTHGPVELSLQSISYPPGHSSGWHSHPGLHLVSIRSGTLTIVEADCQPKTFGSGQFYVGGERLHDARNDSDAPLEMAVTYITQPGQSMQHFRIDGAAPADCTIR